MTQASPKPAKTASHLPLLALIVAGITVLLTGIFGLWTYKTGWLSP